MQIIIVSRAPEGRAVANEIMSLLESLGLIVNPGSELTYPAEKSYQHETILREIKGDSVSLRFLEE